MKIFLLRFVFWFFCLAGFLMCTEVVFHCLDFIMDYFTRHERFVSLCLLGALLITIANKPSKS